MTTAGSIARSGLIVGSAFFVGRILGWARVVVIGTTFGASADLDSFYTAFRIPDLIFQLVAAGALASALLPTLTVLIAEDRRKQAWRVASSVGNALLGSLLVLAVAAFVAAPLFVPVIAPGFTAEQVSRTVEHHLRGSRKIGHRIAAAPEGGNGFLQPAQIQIESNRVGMPRLLRSEEIPRSPNLQILEGDPVPGAQVGMMLQHLQPFLGHRVHQVGGDQIAVGPPVAPSHPPPKLIELGQAQPVGIVHHHGIGIGHVQAGFHDHRGH